MAKAKKTDAKTKTTAADIRALTDDQIAKRVTDLAKEKMNLRFQKVSGQQENPKAVLPLRKEVARLKTEQSARRNKKTA
jgi:large subunit ribosomal protein L29